MWIQKKGGKTIISLLILVNLFVRMARNKKAMIQSSLRVCSLNVFPLCLVCPSVGQLTSDSRLTIEEMRG